MVEMVVEPKVKGFICISSHPEGCYQEVFKQVASAKQVSMTGPKRVLVIGSSTGYGLASRIVSAFSCRAETIGVLYERPATSKRTASAGWYNTVAFEKLAEQEGLYAKSINGDAFSDEIKQQCIDCIKKDWGQVDAVIYSLASPRRQDPETGEVYQSVLKTTDGVYEAITVDPLREVSKSVSIDPATEEEIRQTVAVMGGDDWLRWIDQLDAAGVLAEGFQTIAYSYVGPSLTHPIYKEGTIGCAKDHLLKTADQLSERLAAIKGRALVSVNKAVVTQSSAAIPVVPLYLSILFEEMKAAGLHEDCIEQMLRLQKDRLSSGASLDLDDQGRIRMDDWEMRDDIQEKIANLWSSMTVDSINERVDFSLYQEDFYQLFGFHVEGVDYTVPVEIDRPIPSMIGA